MKEQRLSPVELAWWLLAAALAVVLLLITPKLSANTGGRLVTTVLLLVLLVMLYLAIWNLQWFRSKWFRVVLAWVVCFVGTMLLGIWLWPRTLEVSPVRVVFWDSFATGGVNTQTYTFRVVNRSDDDIFASRINLVVDDPAKSGATLNWLFRKTVGNHWLRGGEGTRFTDIIGLFCREASSRRPAYFISIGKLAGHESRELRITHTHPHKVAVSAETGPFSTQPEPTSVEGTHVEISFRSDVDTRKNGSIVVDLGSCRMIQIRSTLECIGSAATMESN